jgi:hypothetical protein
MKQRALHRSVSSLARENYQSWCEVNPEWCRYGPELVLTSRGQAGAKIAKSLSGADSVTIFGIDWKLLLGGALLAWYVTR